MILFRGPRLLLCGPYYTVTIILYDYYSILPRIHNNKSIYYGLLILLCRKHKDWGESLDQRKVTLLFIYLYKHYLCLLADSAAEEYNAFFYSLVSSVSVMYTKLPFNSMNRTLRKCFTQQNVRDFWLIKDTVLKYAEDILSVG